MIKIKDFLLILENTCNLRTTGRLYYCIYARTHVRTNVSHMENAEGMQGENVH